MKLRQLFMLPLVLAAFLFTACSDDDDDKTTIPNMPESVIDSFKQHFPDVDINGVKFEKSGQYYTAEYKKNAGLVEVEAWFSNAGQLKMTETDYGKDFFLVPPAINAAFVKTEYRDWTVDDISFYEYPDATANFYLIEVEKVGQTDTDIYFKPDGTLIKATPHTGVDITPDTQI